ncbi:xylose isomerase-like protein [Laetiporus sulphureus 93-53]|uniref:Xylose isomerase-like protein n=1 Tax=Laetiporus sulphureus 93-53 TaxID=1314785 RepID=A0A165BGX3_9APHY|nr:xylose isomerase-like protein [Laetiporus sulphureus 93-53]KZT01032.1 xylose isomerase-like protein [Laetiporus sulphureus 93-53]
MLSTSPLAQILSQTLAYSTDSAGMHPSHILPDKLRAIAAAGFLFAEVAFPDLEMYASQLHPDYKKLDDGGQRDLDKLIGAANEISKLCNSLGVKLLAVHPFSELEGYADEAKRAHGMERAHAWFKVLKALNCEILQVSSSDDPSSSKDRNLIARDLRDLADAAAKEQPPIKIAYEMWAWGCHINTWEDTWDICKRVDRPNFGLCLDTFQICARAFASPTSPTGLLQPLFSASNPSANPFSTEYASQLLRNSLSRLADTLPPEKIFYFQISDGAHPGGANGGKRGIEELKQSARKKGIDPLYAWSNAWRPLPYMDELVGRKYGGYLPVVDVCEAVLKTGWRGPFSFEVFYERDMSIEDPTVPERWTRAAQGSFERIMQELKARGIEV